MNEEQLLYKIKHLENELDAFRRQEQYMEIKIKKVYEIARYNAEKIISKAVDIAYAIKENLKRSLDEIQDFLTEENKQEILNHFISKNKEIFEIDKIKIKELSQKIADIMKK